LFHEVRPKELTISSSESTISFEVINGTHNFTLKIDEGSEESGYFHFNNKGFMYVHYSIKPNNFLKLLNITTSMNTFDYKVSMSLDQDRGENETGFYLKEISFECELRSLC
jgi:hypothetical protein